MEPDRSGDDTFSPNTLDEATDTYVSDEEVTLLKTEIDVLGDADEAATAERLLREALPRATLALIKISEHGQSERTRFEAARYILERNLGRLQDINAKSIDDPLTRLARQIAGYED